jgi:hypothetical protein
MHILLIIKPWLFHLIGIPTDFEVWFLIKLKPHDCMLILLCTYQNI